MKQNYRSVILSNCANKIFTGNGDYTELEWWSKEFGTHREWKMSTTIDMSKMQYEPKRSGVKWDWTPYFKPEKLQNIAAKGCAYKIRGDNGKPMIGPANLSFLASKYKEPQKIKAYDFGKFSDGVTTSTEDDDDPAGLRKKKFDLKNLDFKDERDEINPVQTDTTDSKYLFDNEDAIIVNLKKRNPNSDNS